MKRLDFWDWTGRITVAMAVATLTILALCAVVLAIHGTIYCTQVSCK